MAMFQKGIIDKYLREIDKDLLDEKYSLFKSIFFSSEKQKNIRESKEEQYQEGFIRDLFCRVLGYTIKPEANYNILTELKNETSDKNNAKKSDAAIIINGEVKAVIELKGTNTTDLNRVAFQAFSYKNHHENCPYVIVSNFERLRFYVETQIEFIEFDLFHLSKENFDLLYLLLSLESVTSNLALKLKHETLSEEKNITEAFYRDYSAFKRELFEDICSHNSSQNRLSLFKKTQKLLDRILFILFCEDRGLLPANSVKGIISDFKNLKKMGFYQSLYNVFKNFFERINHGFTNPDDHTRDVFAYNGGLFKSDEVLDSIMVGDVVLLKHCGVLSDYDFQSQISVDILGRIFENSLSEIEQVALEAEKQVALEAENDLTPLTKQPVASSLQSGEGEVKKISKRKKDGVFYTPEYITKYIVENTIARLCEEKREELKIRDEEFDKGKGEKSLDERLSQYREWLLELKILDPACGSGAFLNAALKQLQKEHDLIAKYWAKLHPNELYFENIDNVILENNLFGVDINEESVEIAKLSLWLSTAKKNRKLSTLANNIKCGNSLISDKAVAGEKAFDWKNEFSSVFEKGGFDVIIGNPPYVFAREKVSEAEKRYYTKHYTSAKYQVNTYILFIEQCQKLLKEHGYCGLIVPNSWLMVYSGEDLRKYLLENVTVQKIVSLVGKSFQDANVETVILIDEKAKANENSAIEVLNNIDEHQKFELSHTVQQSDFSKNKGFEFTVFKNDESSKLIEKIKENCIGLDEAACVKAGLQAYEKGKGTPKQTAEDVKNRPYDYDYKFDDDTYKYLDGADVLRYGIHWSGTWLRYGKHLAAPRTFDLFYGEKIIVREITSEFPKCLNATYSDEIYLYNRSNIAVVKRNDDFSLKYILALLNSALMSYYFKKNTAKAERKLFPKVILNDLRLFPIKKISFDKQKPFVELADKMLSLNEQIQKKSAKFISRVKDNLNVQKISSALESFYALSFSEFVKELGKQKVKLSLKEQDEWEEYFGEYKAEIRALKADIDKTDKAINAAVYALYGLTAEEISEIEKV